MPDEPLIFIEVALLKGMARSIGELLDESAPAEDPQSADTAIFYSISNAQPGLRGVSFGSFLIRQVVDDLTRDFKGLKTFATLSPMPGFRAWLDERIAAGDDSVVTQAEARQMREHGTAESGAALLGELLSRHGWAHEPDLAEVLEAPLLRLAARYLLEESAEGQARDRVAHFHLSNGARVERINWGADLSPRGLRHSLGLMVNYRYQLGEIESNHEAYRGQGKVTTSAAVRALLKR